MSITKKIRFEIFKRDGFQCAYCGRTPPEVTLEVDHIKPVSMGGTDDINNLITSCFDCNRGKRDIPINKAPNKLKDNYQILLEKEEQLKEYYKLIKKIKRRTDRQHKKLEEIIDYYFPEHPDNVYEFCDTFKNITLKRFYSALPFNEIEESMHLACNKMSELLDDNIEDFEVYRDKALKYFCGICWNKIRDTKPPYQED